MRRYIWMLALATALFLPAHSQTKPTEAEASGVREIDLSAYVAARIPKGDTLRFALEHIRATGADEVMKLASFKEGVAKHLEEKVDFKKEDIIYFHWRGSGQDRISCRIDEENKKAIFSYHKGMTEDLRVHHKFFIVNKGLSFAKE